MKKVLVANRGEIARRIIRTCQRLGIETIAIYSEADQELPFVKEATEAVCIGPSQVAQSYLKADEIITIAKERGVDGIHPGYGLLSENADFAEKVRAAGMKFIGPEAEVIRSMGDKIEARQTMIKANVPVVPGTEEGLQSLEEALAYANEIGFPVMLKASSGGGGIGMVRCETEQALTQNFDSIKTRAKSYFGDDQVFVEKFIPNARHIEVQIFGDDHGNVVHLFERNCSVQRRNQKVIEESPSPSFPEASRQLLFEAAVQAAKAVNYTNAGTVEFIVDSNNDFYFLEMNTRLQVEHPVTEAITGFDLVEWQLLVADGQPLPVIHQQEITSKGHAIEYRIYAEDPVKFFPSPGTIQTMKIAKENDRLDTGYEEGNKVTPFYDPLIAKLIVQGATREEVIDRSKHIFESSVIEGVKSNISLFTEFVDSSAFRQGDYDTNVLVNWLAQPKEEK